MSESSDAEKPGLIALGRIVRAQGLRGEVRVKPFGIGPELTERIEEKPLFVRRPETAEPIRAVTLECQRWQRDVWVVGFTEVTTRTEAEALAGWDVCLAESDLPPLGPNEYYDDELVGLRVQTAQSGELLGQVVAVKPSAAADLLEVRRPEGGTFTIPMVRAMIVEVNLFSNVIRVDLPEGLIDLNP